VSERGGGRVGFAIVDATRLSASNRERQEELEDRQAALSARGERERLAQELRRREVYDEVLVPFQAAFSRLKNVDLAELAEFVLPGDTQLPTIELTQVRVSALRAVGAVAGGLTSGAGAGAAAYAAVGAFAAASTGTPIAALSGAAATNATLAFLGGGAIASGGGGVALGTAVLGGLVAAPVLVASAAFLSWHGRSARRTQREIATSLDTAESEFALTEQRASAVLARSRQFRSLLVDLHEVVAARLPVLAALVDANDDYATFTPEQRRQVITVVGLVTATVALMATPLTDDTGAVSTVSGQVIAETRSQLDDCSDAGQA
jgi:hypothetical protein